MRCTAIIHEEDGAFVAWCPEWDVASQGDTVGVARDNLKEAMELFFEVVPVDEMEHRRCGNIFVTQIDVVVSPIRNFLP
ncbi:MAG: type II toxin-antitoxin system HicB family antitoxin [Deltaproteobacteria bacterium]|nr:type II toxin-antitoxin system HicB family antitoxin [Deltaproteobacteria bacterium]